MADKPSVIEAPGIYEMPEDDYFADPVLAGSLSCTWAKQLAQPGGPAKWKWEREHPQPSKKHFDLGHAAHALVLGVGAPIDEIPFDETFPFDAAEVHRFRANEIAVFVGTEEEIAAWLKENYIDKGKLGVATGEGFYKYA